MAKAARNDHGQFQPGHPGGPGRPARAVESAYLRTLADVVDTDTWRLICERARDNALAGDPKARAWLASYLLPSGGGLVAAYADADSGADPVAAEIRRREVAAAFDFTFS